MVDRTAVTRASLALGGSTQEPRPAATLIITAWLVL